MSKPPPRYRAPETPDEHLLAIQASARGEEEPRIETADYKRYRADALRAAGLTAEADDAEPDAAPDPATMTPAEHFDDLRRR